MLENVLPQLRREKRVMFVRVGHLVSVERGSGDEKVLHLAETCTHLRELGKARSKDSKTPGLS